MADTGGGKLECSRISMPFPIFEYFFETDLIQWSNLVLRHASGGLVVRGGERVEFLSVDPID